MSKHVASSSEQVDLQAITDFFGNVALPLDETLQRGTGITAIFRSSGLLKLLRPSNNLVLIQRVVFEPNDSDDTKQSVRPKYTLTQCATDSGFSEEELAR